MTNAQQFDDGWPSGSQACCRVSRQPVFTSPRWCWVSPAGRYGIRVTRIGPRIISLEAWGHVDLNHIRRGWAVINQALADAPPDRGPFIVIDDHSRISGATLNARTYIAQQLQRLSNWRAYIAYGAPSVFELGLNLARRMRLFSFEIQVVADYDQAVRMAQEWQARPRQATPRGSTAGDDHQPLPEATAPTDPRELALQSYARELFHHVGQLSLNRYGVVAVPDNRSSDHPFRSVYDALAMIHADMLRILARHQRNQRRLQKQERALLAQNAALAETQTTLGILLRTRQEERRKHTGRVGQRFKDLLLPIVEGLAATQLTARQERQVEFIRDIIAHIGHAFSFNPMVNLLKLTPRETLTAYLVARGCRSREAAEVMNTSPRTVERYRAALRKKAGLAGTGLPLGPWLSRQRDDGSASGAVRQ